jgi:uncharacterized protein
LTFCHVFSLSAPPWTIILSDSFDPFTDRKSRDIRNRLSDAMMQAVDAPNRDRFEFAIAELLEQDPVPSHQSYVNDRLRQYRLAFAEIKSRGLTDKFSQALVLWNHGLFFEAHERLETVWQESSGEYREALKGLIQAAGAFLHMAHGHLGSANRLAAKARNLLEKRGHLLPIDVMELVGALEGDHMKAPRL